MENKQKKQLVIEVIRFFKKWALWGSVDIFCNNIRYSCFRFDESTEGSGDLSGVYIAPSFDKATTEHTEYYGEPLMTILFEGVGFSELISSGFYNAPVYELTDDVLFLIAKNEGLLNYYEEKYKCCPILDYTEFESYEEFREMETELEKQEILKELRTVGSIRCSQRTVDAIKEEFDSIFVRYGIKRYPIGNIWGYACFEKMK